MPSQIYTLKPPKTSEFEYSRKLDNLREPENIIEDLNFAFNRIKNLFDKKEAE